MKKHPRDAKAVRQEIMRKALETAPQTLDRLVRVSGLGKAAVTRWVRNMQGMKACHLCDWTEDSRGRVFTAVYTWGKGKNVARPEAHDTSAERMRNMRARRKEAA